MNETDDINMMEKITLKQAPTNCMIVNDMRYEKRRMETNGEGSLHSFMEGFDFD